MTTLSQGWAAYHRGSYDQALRHFESADGELAVAGHALTLLAMGRGREATAAAEQARQRNSSRFLTGVLADVKGRQGSRGEAEKLLVNSSSNTDLTGFYRSLLGEQRLRQGKWDLGTNDFIAALNRRDERTFPHVKRVVADMVDAVAARRIPRPDAVKFINRIDYSASDKTPEMNAFFASARRAINSNQRMDRSGLVEPWSVGAGLAAPSTAPPGSRPSTTQQSRRPQNQNQRRRRNAPASRPPTQRRSSSPPAPRSAPPQRSRQSRRANSQQRRQNEMQRRLSQRADDSSSKHDLLMQADRKNLTAYMNQARRENECLQELVEEMPPPMWPSEQKNSIDFIKPIGFSRKAILPGSSSISTANFRITGGDIGVEVTLERCMHNLIAAAQEAAPTTLPLDLPSIPRMELNLLDDFLKAMPDLDRLYSQEHQVDDPQTLAVGKFIGECIIQSYGGVWDHRVPPQKSTIFIGDHELDPIGMAEKFLTTQDFDSVSLRDLIHQAEKAVYTSTAMPNFTPYIDSTTGLEGEGLVMGLSELWVGYRFVMPDTKLPAVAESLKIQSTTPNFVAFQLGAQFVPSVIADHVDGSTDSEGRIGMAYLRDTGEFLILPSRKHFCRFLESGKVKIARENVPAVAQLLDTYFRPGWTVVVNRELADRVNRKISGAEVTPPGLREKDGKIDLRVHAIDQRGKSRIIQLSNRPKGTPPFTLKLR